MAQQEKRGRQPVDSDTCKPAKKGWRRLRRAMMIVIAVLLLGLLLVWLYLPRIAERVLREAVAESGLESYEFQLKRIGPGTAVLEAVRLKDGDWQVQADRVLVHYELSELRSGKIQELALEGMKLDLDLPDEPGTEQDLKAVWIHDLPDLMERVGSIRADGTKLTIGHLGRSATRGMDLAVDVADDGRISMQVDADDFKLGVELENTDRRAELFVQVNDMRPVPFLTMLQVVTGLESPILPEGLSVAKAEMEGGLIVEHGVLSPLKLDGILSGLVYGGPGERSPRLVAGKAEMKLMVDLAGQGSIDLVGKLDELSLPVDPSAGLELSQRQGDHASWQLGLTWGIESTRLKGSVGNLSLSGQYHDKLVELEDGAFEFQLAENILKATGDFSNGGVKIPVRYRHELKSRRTGWTMEGRTELGPFSHGHTLPAVRAAIGFFDDVEMAGESALSLDFSIGSDEPLRGKMITRLMGGTVNVANGKLKASRVKAMHQLHIRADAGQNGGDSQGGDYQTLNVAVARLEIASKDALGFDLIHEAESPAIVTAKGSLEGNGTQLAGAISGLGLHAEKGGNELHLENIGLLFELQDDSLKAEGSMTMAGNEIPFTYRHDRRESGDGWKLDGVAGVRDADLKQPVANAVMFMDAMEGKSISGKLSMKLDFSVGSEQDFDGVLQASIRDGTLVFADDGPVIEGIAAEVKLDSLARKTTVDFHRVRASKMTAFDIPMSDLGLEFRLMPGGDVKLRNIGLKTLGGQITIDDFVLPGDGADYAFKVRARKLDVSRLAELFPDFSGSISGSIDGLLPLEMKNGEIIPGRGGMYLTPKTRGKLIYDAGNSFSAGLNPKTEEYKRMKMLEESLRDLELKVLSIRLFDPRDKDKAVVLRLEGQAPNIEGSPPIHLNINGFKPDDETMDFFDLLLRQRDRINFGL